MARPSWMGLPLRTVSVYWAGWPERTCSPQPQ
jgi:hypothetical protein